MVGVAVAMMIWKKFQNSVIYTSRNHNDEIAEVSVIIF